LRLCDEYGEGAGRALLRRIASSIVELAGANTTVARLYGSSFVVVMKYAAKDEVEHMARRISTELADIHEVGGVSCTVRSHVGIAFEDESATVDGLINLAVEKGQRSKNEAD
jgi:GGDEF domain-containing protein